MDADAPAYAVILCSRCRDPVSGALAARALIEQLGGPRALATRPDARQPHAHAAGRRFRVETVPCVAGCDRPLAVAFRAPNKASTLFGGIDPQTDAPALLAFGELYASLPDGLCGESERPAPLRNKTLARIPAEPRSDREPA